MIFKAILIDYLQEYIDAVHASVVEELNLKEDMAYFTNGYKILITQYLNPLVSTITKNVFSLVS